MLLQFDSEEGEPNFKEFLKMSKNKMTTAEEIEANRLSSKRTPQCPDNEYREERQKRAGGKV
jgi:hypothetical protein